LREAEEARDAEAARTAELEASTEEAKRTAAFEAENARSFEERLKEKEAKFKLESCAKAVLDMELTRLREELQAMKTTLESAHSRNSEMERKTAQVEEERREFEERAMKSERALRSIEEAAALEAQKAARTQEIVAEEYVHVGCRGTTDSATEDDWACI